MQLHQLEHLIRAAGTVTNRYEFIVVGLALFGVIGGQAKSRCDVETRVLKLRE